MGLGPGRHAARHPGSGNGTAVDNGLSRQSHRSKFTPTWNSFIRRPLPTEHCVLGLRNHQLRMTRDHTQATVSEGARVMLCALPNVLGRRGPGCGIHRDPKHGKGGHVRDSTAVTQNDRSMRQACSGGICHSMLLPTRLPQGASSTKRFSLCNHTLATSYVPRYSPLPSADHDDLSAPPRKRARTPFSRYICFATRYPLAVWESVLRESLPPADSIILVFTTSVGVVITAANAPDAAALTPVMTPVSVRLRFWLAKSAHFNDDLLSFHAHIRALTVSNTGNCTAVKGRLRAARAAYPVHSRRVAPPSASRIMRRAARDELSVVVVPPERRSI